MKPSLRILAVTAALLLPLGVTSLRAETIKLVTPDPIPEAVALFDTLQAISGRYTLIGQHNYPATRDRNSQFAAKYFGRMPAVWTSDFGFAAEGDTDSVFARPDIVDEAIRQHRMGALVSICWHAVPPTADEPVTFRPEPGADPAMLQSVQGQLLDEQFKDVLTPGTALHAKWEAQVDAVAVFLKQLEEARVPVLWRPYHELNGGWFWWGGRSAGEYTTAALYRQIFDRLMKHHGLRNLIWEWSTDRVGKPGMEHEKFFPGIEFVDVLALDVYGSDFSQSYYDSLVALSQGKPLALAEVGNPPTPEVLAKQPLWTYYATWAGMVRNTTRKQYAELLKDPRVLGLDDKAYAAAMAAYRQACVLPPIAIVPPPADFSGTWVINEEGSSFGSFGPGFAPAKLEIGHKDGVLTVKTTMIREYAEDEVIEQTLPLDGTEVKGVFRNFPRVTTAKVGDGGASIEVGTVTDLPFETNGLKVKANDTWTLSRTGTQLTIHSISDSFRGPEKIEQTFVFDRR